MVKPYSVDNEYNAASLGVAADPVVQYMTVDDLRKNVARVEKAMVKAAKEMDFLEAARLRDEMIRLSDMIKQREAAGA